jgi:hypothetical protein
LQKELGARARIQDFFDIAFGTSAGKMASCCSLPLPALPIYPSYPLSSLVMN